MTLAFHGLAMVCALGATVFAALAAPRRRDLASFAAGVAAGAGIVLMGWSPDVALVSGVAALLAVGFLLRPAWSPVLALGGGTLGGIWIGLLNLQGLPVWAAAPAAASAFALTAYLARTRRDFAPELLREEALLAIALIGAAVAALPAVLDGWSAAANLTAVQADEGATADSAIPRWALVLVGLSLLGGMARSMWSRR